jgi:hypothetical protein
MTFTPAGEATLTSWMELHAYVSFTVNAAPWIAEHEMIKTISLPLNLDGNRHHGFHQVLSATRAAAKSAARELPTV